MKKIDIIDVKLDRLSVIFFYYLSLYPDFRTFTLKDLKIKIPAYRPAKNIDIEARIDIWKIAGAVNLEESTNQTGEKEYRILKINHELEDIEIFYEIKEQVSEEEAIKWIQEAKAKVYKKKAAQESAFDGVLSTLAESEKVNDLKQRKENFVKWYENSINPLRYYNVDNPLELAKKLSNDSHFNKNIPISFSHFYFGKLYTEKIFKDACEDRFNELLPIEVLVEKINELETRNQQKHNKKKESKSYPKNNQSKLKNHSLTDIQIIALFTAIKGKFIASDTTLEQFQTLFDGEITKMIEPVQWTGSNRLLVYLLGKLFIREWQSYFKNKEAFINKRSKPLTSSDFSSALSDSNIMGFPVGSDKIDKILDAIRKQNV